MALLRLPSRATAAAFPLHFAHRAVSKAAILRRIQGGYVAGSRHTGVTHYSLGTSFFGGSAVSSSNTVPSASLACSAALPARS